MEKSHNTEPTLAVAPGEAPGTAITIDSAASTLQPEPRSERSSRGREASFFSRMSHTEYHLEDNGVVRDIIIGFADGLTVPFALTAGLSSNVPHSACLSYA